MGRATLIATISLASSLASAQLVRPELRSSLSIEGEGGPRSIEVTIEVSAEGRATLLECDESPSTCARVRDALEHAELAPATRDGAPIASRIRVEVGVDVSVDVSAEPPSGPDAVDASTSMALPPSPYGADESELGLEAEVAPAPPPGATRLPLEETRDEPGTLGDPLRAVLDLPGIVPLVSGLPYFYLRGAPALGTAFVYDGMPMPALYHLGIGPAVLHPRMVGAIEVRSGIAPARYGAHVGGVVVGEGPRLGVATEAEVELRAIDLSAYIQSSEGPVRYAGAVRFGYPGVIVSALVPEVDLAYGDYQARLRVDLGGHGRLELVTLGSYDSLSLTTPSPTDTTILFSRTELRYVRECGGTELGLALRGGYDDASFHGGFATLQMDVISRLGSAGARMWVAHRAPGLELRAGLDASAIAGYVRATSPDSAGGIGPSLSELLASARQRTRASAYAELSWDPLPQLRLMGGIRGDLWMSIGGLSTSVDPRARVQWRPLELLSLHAAFGLAHQPAAFFLPVPGPSELPLGHRLQRGIQSEVGARMHGRSGDTELEASTTLYLHRYEGIVGGNMLSNARAGCRYTAGSYYCIYDPRDPVNESSWAWGVEVFGRVRGPYVSARVAYTLAWAQPDPLGSFLYTLTNDIRHVVTAVLQVDSRVGFVAGVRLFLRSGMVQGSNYASPEDTLWRYEQELPAWGRLDVNVSYEWDAGWARLRVIGELLNATFALGGEPQDLDCGGSLRYPLRPCAVTHWPPIFAPNVGIRGTFR